MKKIIRYISILFLILLIILGAVAWLVRSEYGQNKIKTIALKQINQSINGEFIIEELNSNFVSRIELKNIKLLTAEDTIASIDNIYIHYKLRKLLKREIWVDSLIIQSPYTQLKIDDDSVLNLSKIFNSSREKDTTSVITFPFSINAKLIKLNNGQCDLTNFNSLVPKQINNINLSCRGGFINKKITAKLDNFNFQTDQPEFKLNHLSLNASYFKRQLSVDSLLLKTVQNSLFIKGNYNAKNNFKADISTDSLNLDEFEFFIPKLHFKAIPIVKIKTSAQNDTFAINAIVEHQKEKLILKAKQFHTQNKKFINRPYSIQLNALNIIVSNWGIENELPIIINGDIRASGSSLNFTNDPISLNAKLNNSSAYGFAPDTFYLKGKYSPQQSNGSINISDTLGSAVINFDLQKRNKQYSYSLNTKIDSFKLGSLFPHLSHSNINLEAEINGNGFKPQSMSANAKINIKNSLVKNITIDSLHSSARLKNGIAYFGNLTAFNPNEKININGTYHLKNKELNADFNANFSNLKDLYPYIKDTQIKSKATIEGHVSGPHDSLILLSSFSFDSPNRGDVKAKSISGNCSLHIQKQLLGKIQAKSELVEIDNLKIDSINLSTEFTTSRFSNEIELFNLDNFHLSSSSLVSLKNDSIIITMPYTVIETEGIKLKNLHNDQKIILNKNAYSFEHVEFIDELNDNFIFQLNGLFNPMNQSNLALSIKDFDLKLLDKWVHKYPLTGLLQLETRLNGDGSNPELNSTIQIDSLKYKMLSPPIIFSNINIKDQFLSTKLYFVDRAGDSITTSLDFPLTFNLKENNYGLLPEFPIIGNINCEKIDIHEYMRNNTSYSNTQGIISFNASLSGTNSQPKLDGYFHLNDGKFKLPQFGIDYEDIKTKLTITQDQISLDSLYIKGGNGYFLSSGTAKLDSNLLNGQPNLLQLNIKARNFHVSKARAHDITFNSDIEVKTNNKTPEYNGNIDVTRSSFYLPDLARLNTGANNENEPLLVQALKKLDTDTIQQVESVLIKDTINSNPFLPAINNLRGSVKVTIPKNTWIKSEELKLEISGEIDVVKNSKYFEYLGEIEILRGNYYLYGRRFNFLDGEIIFTGGDKFDPTINIEAEYVFRGADREVETLKLFITGTSEEPELNFTLNNNSINEGEAISYIIYNRSSDEIGYDNQKGLASAVSSGIMSKMVSSQLNKTIGNRLNLDMIELNTEDNWQSMDFVVGKYITNDLFVIYQKGFGENNNNEITPESVTLEYEILKNLFIQIQSGNSNTSGFDVILKFEKQNP